MMEMGGGTPRSGQQPVPVEPPVPTPTPPVVEPPVPPVEVIDAWRREDAIADRCQPVEPVDAWDLHPPITDVPDRVDDRMDPSRWSPVDEVLAGLDAIPHQRRWAGCGELVTVVQWADLHPGEGVPPARVPGQERPVQIGGHGTPGVAEFAIAEMAAVLGVSVVTGRRLLADALDVRHRLPRLWGRVERVGVEAWQARKIAQATRPLTLAQARRVDARVAGVVGRLPWGRLQAIVDAAVIEADPDRAARLADQTRHETKMHVGHSDDHGLATVYARVETADAVWLQAQVTRLADLLHTVHSDQRPVDQRRATALGLLARPAEAIKLILAGTGRPDDNPGVERSRDDTTSPGGTDAPLDPTGGAEVPPEPVETEPVEPEPVEPEPVDPATAAVLESVDRLDPARLAPPVTLYAHVAWETLTRGRGVCRIENIGPIVAPVAQQWLTHTRVAVKPVIDLPAGQQPVDGYEVPDRMREHLTLRHPHTVFPYSPGRSCTADADHTQPYQWPHRSEPLIPGQTGLHNLGPLGRFDHRLVTHGGWQHRQPEPGTHLLRAPHGHLWLINNTGTHHLGNTPFAQTVWHTALR